MQKQKMGYWFGSFVRNILVIFWGGFIVVSVFYISHKLDLAEMLQIRGLKNLDIEADPLAKNILEGEDMPAIIAETKNIYLRYNLIFLTSMLALYHWVSLLFYKVGKGFPLLYGDAFPWIYIPVFFAASRPSMFYFDVHYWVIIFLVLVAVIEVIRHFALKNILKFAKLNAESQN